MPLNWAGLLHDCAKYMDDDTKNTTSCREYKTSLQPMQKYKNPSLLHAKVVAILQKQEYHITDFEILHANPCPYRQEFRT